MTFIHLYYKFIYKRVQLQLQKLILLNFFLLFFLFLYFFACALAFKCFSFLCYYFVCESFITICMYLYVHIQISFYYYFLQKKIYILFMQEKYFKINRINVIHIFKACSFVLHFTIYYVFISLLCVCTF